MLFNDIKEIRNLLPVGAGNDFNRLKPHIQNAENKYIKTLLGTALFDELQEFYDESPYETLTEVQQAMNELLKIVQHSLIHLAYFVGFDFLNVSISDAGFQRTEAENKKGLFKYQEDNLKEYFSDAGFNGLDAILVFIETNIQHFTEFKSTPNWTELKTSFIPTVRILEQIPFNIFGSRLTFLNLKPHLFFIEDTAIRQTLGETIYQEIKTETAKDSPAEKVTAILPYIRKPLVYLASAMLMEETGATLGKNGLFFEKLNGNYIDNRTKQPSTEQRIVAMVNRNRGIGLGYLDALKSYLLSNVESWETFEGKAGTLSERDNTDKKTFWA